MLPREFVDSMRQQLDVDANLLCKALETEPITSIRLNDKLEEVSFPCDFEEVPWHIDGYYLSERPAFTLDPLFHAGCYYVQEASSMFLQQALDQYVEPESVVLDLCAAPGGKSTIISQHLGSEGLLISNEVVRQRLFILSENLQKWGNGNAVVTHNSAEDFGTKCTNLFDCILVDAPCSGEGMFRKDPDAIAEWSLRNVHQCAERQRKILMDVWDALKPGGVLIYSTCTFNNEEDEENAKWIAECLGAEILPLEHDESWGIEEGEVGYHFYPHKVKGEGFYIAVFRKNLEPFAPFKPKAPKNPTQCNATYEAVMRTWLQHPDDWVIKQSDRFMTAYSAKYRDIIEYLNDKFTCVLLGFGIGEERGNGVAPQHSLAMLKDIRKEAFRTVELTREQALDYLRTEAIQLTDVPFGIILLTYEGVCLGFGKNVGNRLNNLYPKEWRIRNL